MKIFARVILAVVVLCILIYVVTIFHHSSTEIVPRTYPGKAGNDSQSLSLYTDPWNRFSFKYPASYTLNELPAPSPELLLQISEGKEPTITKRDELITPNSLVVVLHKNSTDTSDYNYDTADIRVTLHDLSLTQIQQLLQKNTIAHGTCTPNYCSLSMGTSTPGYFFDFGNGATLKFEFSTAVSNTSEILGSVSVSSTK